MKAPEKIYCTQYTESIKSLSFAPLHSTDIEYTRSDLCMVWQPIADAPRDGTEVVILTEDGAIQASWDKECHGGKGGWNPIVLDYHGCGCCGGYRPDATHFMLVKPPENTQ
jgi:hypothetical protein